MAISERPDLIGDGARSPWDGQRMTLVEFLALPEQKPALEYADGVVRQKMAPTPDHDELQVILCNALNATADRQDLGHTFTEIRFRLGDVVYVPDVGYYHLERLELVEGKRYARNLGVPDIVVEIVSPDQSMTTLIVKCQRYLVLGAALALIVDPDDEAVLVFRSGQPVRVLQGDDRMDVDDVLPDVSLTVRGLFDAIVPPRIRRAARQRQGTPDSRGEEGQADDAAASGRSGEGDG